MKKVMHLRESKEGFMGEVEGKTGRGEVSLYFNFKNKKKLMKISKS